MSNLKWTGERLVTSLGAVHGAVEHLHRYALAREIAKNKVVLDIASGEGYGSFLLSKNAKKVYGVDIDSESVVHAQKKYAASENLEYLCGSTSKIPLADHSVDVVVSFETLEHHDEHDLMMVEISRVLKGDGYLLISSPEKSIYKQRDPVNPYHIKELSFDEFTILINRFFSFTHFFAQRFVIGSLIHSTESDTKSGFKMFDGSYSEIWEGLKEDEFYNKPFFNLAICSNADVINNLLPLYSLFNGVEVVKHQIESLEDVNNRLINSFSYRITKWFSRLNAFIKSKIKRISVAKV
jgi:ubiquinone/menaquinone biosynthesis C-methylase UbiE